MNFDKKKEGFHFLGLNKQDIIKYFFGGNASLAIFILLLIILFLFREAYLFLPNHHAQLKTYRRSGLEYFTWIERSYQKYKIEVGGLSRAFQAEISYPNRENQQIISAYDATRLVAERALGKDLLVLKDAISQLDDEFRKDSDKAKKLEKVIEELKVKIEKRRPEIRKLLTVRKSRELRKLSEEDREKVVEAVAGLQFWERGEAEYYEKVNERFDQVYSEAYPKAKILYDEFMLFKNKLTKPLDEVWKEASLHARTIRDRADSNELVPRKVQGQVNVGLANESTAIRQQKFGTAMREIGNAEFFNEYARLFYLQRFSDVIKNLKPDGSAYNSVPSAVRKKTEEILNSAEGPQAEFLAALRIDNPEMDAVLKAIPEDAMDPDERALLYELSRLEPLSDETIRKMSDEIGAFVEDFPFAEEAETLYVLTERYTEAVKSLHKQGDEAIAKLPPPSELQTDFARKEIEQFKKSFQKNITDLENTGRRLEAWRHDKPWTYLETAGAFFVGKQWTNNSQIQDRYGILPLFTGSIIISLIALTIAVPISVSGAIYVNQIAPFSEQAFLKPAIEFIEAIPSVVLGFLGIAVVSQLLKDMSEIPALSWWPGFPIESRLNMLVAGVLLAFMACPIIFTLAEDALNNVPTAYRDGSLSLGATRLQTAFRVVLPASLSGVLAAVLLGFGRVIGETMVVLLVAGNRINIPDFSKGIGVVTEPSHTMTGMIAQGLGEAAKDSIDWWALFMVGLVLFAITLVINYIGQKILHRFEAK